jgi:hypothetical protein
MQHLAGHPMPMFEPLHDLNNKALFKHYYRIAYQ